MKLFLGTSILAFAIAIGPGSVASAQQEPAYRPAIGKMHPDFRLPSIADGKPLRLSDFRGKKILLLHFASW